MTSNIRLFWYPGGIDSFPDGGSVELVNCSQRMFQNSIRDVGQGKVVENFIEAFSAIAVDDVIQFLVDDVPAAAMICDQYTRTPIAPGEESDKTWLWEGPTTLGVFKRGVVSEPGGVGRDPWVDDITFNFTHPLYIEDPDDWDPATTVCTVEFAQLNDSNVPATAGVDGRWGYLQVWAPNFPQHALSGVGSGTTEILWGSDGTTAGVTTGIGMRAARATFTTSYDGLHYVFFACDNVGQVWIDGKPIMSAGSAVPGTIANPLTSGFTNVQISPVSLSAGDDHVIAFAVTNYPPFGAPNPGGFSAAVYIPGFPPTLVYETLSSNTHITGYVDELPGMTATNVIRLCVEAEQNDGRFTSIDLSSFSDDLDTDGNTLPKVNISTKVGVDLAVFFVEIMQTYLDLVMPPDTWQLKAYLKDAFIPASGVNFTEGVNLLQLEQKGANTAATKFLTRWQGGYADLGATGGWHAFVQLGPDSTGGEVSREVSQLLAVHANPREQIRLAYRPVDSTEVPYVNTSFVHGSTVTANDSTDTPTTERVITITGAQSGNTEPAVFAIDVKDRVEEEQDKVVTAATR